MNESQKIPWKRVSVEAAAIVASILLAFWIDAWWDTQQSQKGELATMNALLSDLNSYRENLDWLDTVYNAIRESAVTLLDASVSNSNSLTDEQVDRLLNELGWTINVTWYEIPTLEALLSNELFSEIDDVDIQRKLAYLVMGIEGVQNDVLRDERFFDEHWTPYLIANASLPQIYRASAHVPGFPDEKYPIDLFTVPVLEKRSHQSLLSDSHFQGLLQERANMLADIFTRVDGFDENLNELIMLLEERVAD